MSSKSVPAWCWLTLVLVRYRPRVFQPVSSYDNTGDEDYEGGWVAAVSVAHKNGKAINKFMKARQLLAQIRSARAKLKKFSMGSKYADLGKLETAKPKRSGCSLLLNRR